MKDKVFNHPHKGRKRRYLCKNASYLVYSKIFTKIYMSLCMSPPMVETLVYVYKLVAVESMYGRSFHTGSIFV